MTWRKYTGTILLGFGIWRLVVIMGFMLGKDMLDLWIGAEYGFGIMSISIAVGSALIFWWWFEKKPKRKKKKRR